MLGKISDYEDVEIVMIDDPSIIPETPTALKWLKPDMSIFSKEWKGFLVSERKKGDTGRRRAKCLYCDMVLADRLPALTKHKLMICKKFAPEDKVISTKRALDPENLSLATTLPSTSSLSQPRIQKLLVSSQTQERAAVLFVRGLISKSVPFRFVEDLNIVQLFDILGAQKLTNRSFLNDQIVPQVFSN